MSQKSKKKKKTKAVVESEIMRLMQKSLKTALDLALEDIMKEWK